MLKYIRFAHSTEGSAFGFTLPPLSHSNLAQMFSVMGYKPVSAGFVDFAADGTVTTHGESVSLKMKPLEDDAARIRAGYAAARHLAGGEDYGANTAPTPTTWKPSGHGFIRADYRATINEKDGVFVWRAYARVIQSGHGRCDTAAQAMAEADASLLASQTTAPAAAVS